MLRAISAFWAAPFTAIFVFAASTPVLAEDEPEIVIDGRCQYTDEVAKFSSETTLILCDSIKIGRNAAGATLDFAQRSWGSMARFTGDMAGSNMAVSEVTLRDGRTVAATGTCEIFYRNDGKMAAISCLVKTGSRPIAANFIPSRF